MSADPALVDRYFDRIGIAAPSAADRAGLAAIIAAHTATIPFESNDPLLGRPPAIDLASVAAKLIDARRGGYCFEQNTLLRAVLTALGYRVTGLGARVLWNQPAGAITAQSHMLLRVDLEDGPVIVDTGFGGATPTAPLDLVAGHDLPTPHGRYRLHRDGDAWRLEAQIVEEWRALYIFPETPVPDIDYQVANWYTGAHPSSHFTYGLTAAIALPDRRLALRNFDLSVHHVGGDTEKRPIDGPDALAGLVERDFGIRLADRAALIARIEQGLR